MPGILKLIVGLGNPGPQHDSNRHNAGVIFLHQLCKSYGGNLRGESKFFGEFGAINIAGNDVKLLFPSTFMNHSGKAVAAVCKFFKIEPKNALVAYDEIDFDVGIARLKEGGGHGGHNGIRDIINAFGGNRDFYRLRIGVGHPGDKSMVSNHVLSNPSRSEADLIKGVIEDAVHVMPKAVTGEWEEAMRLLHTH
ncbi:MAG: aminoacyl-tRNA hydrolase [Gammaproteobacteria bacterium]|jgi:PTH1 family peptidyl-tRNA hydrolase|nr:aminoacyl-tRNA hydrolase [Gammaproteobacteria bacterium]MCH2343460.1 aminoacyl-tRNA hydrolase [Pseudomonadales bacterium]MEE2607753.1 aminoacyl-tRNA hydrolase [Pseudomonadota bacterium]MBE46411.1 aminoacyl-tRNA hydrolase [Gammaproteobacteria bacterium]MCS5580769.1 aminoacyl-tRNA hydrolase [Gammaproteobacteria bacterium]|tara:strand:+ start:3955 stop:4536 length:582 start_codon:yes stop_codon:yes gene_type:complete